MGTQLFARLLLLTSLLVCFGANSAKAQTAYTSGLLPSFGISAPLAERWRLTVRLESRQQLLSGQFGEGLNSDYKNVLTDFIVVPSRKVGSTSTAGAGYMLRTRNGSYYHRAIQQYSMGSKVRSLKVSHRISADQTFSTAEPAEYRLRYRIGTEIPFSGLEIDDRELYGKITNEVLQEVQKGVYDLENRFVAVTGYQFSDSHRLEYGIDYRIASILSSNIKHTFWWQINWQISL